LRHVWSLWYFLRAAIQNPLLTLLGRDIAYAAAVRALDSRRMIEAVVITNSVYPAQPLWMRGPAARGFRVHMVWYSQNAKPLVYKGCVPDECTYSDEPRCRHICVDETWVWTKGFEKWLRGLGLTGPIHVVGPILWYLHERPTIHKDTDIRVVVCDVTPLRDDVALQIGLAENYYSGTNMIRFIEEILWCCRELEERSGRPVHLSLKHKRSYNMKTHDPRYIEYIGRLSAPGGGIELIPFETNMYALFADSDLVIVAPYSSPAYVASTVGIRAIYFDPTKELLPTFEPAPLVAFASGRAELLRVALEAISAPKAQNVYARN
jgi:polysaccharide biosynthesis PFTS motif protein